MNEKNNQDIVCFLPGSQNSTIRRITRFIEHFHLIVLIAVLSILAVSLAIFILGALASFMKIWVAFSHIKIGHPLPVNLLVDFLEIISDMFKAVIFYLVGISFYSLFITPLDLCTTLGIRTIHDLESQLINVVIVILGVEFLERYILWDDPQKILMFSLSAGFFVISLSLFQFLVLRHCKKI